MRKIREVLRLKAMKFTMRQIARTLGISRDAVANYLCRAKAARIAWPIPDSMDDFQLEQLLFPPVQASPAALRRPEPNWEEVYREMQRKGATMNELHAEYLAEHPDGLAYSSFCERFRKFKKSLRKYMRQIHKPGEKAFVDYAGPTVAIINPKTGEERHAQIFVGVLGASNYTFANARWSQKSEDWIMSHVEMFEFFGGVPEVIVCDNLKSAVTKASKTDPQLNESYRDMASHYGTAIFAARPYKPKDKSKAEGSVLLVERWILFRLRKRVFTNLVELNAAIKELLEDLNGRPFQKLQGCRRSAFETLDQPALSPLPICRYEFMRFMKLRVGTDYHVIVDDCRYSVPHNLVGMEVEARVTANTVEVLFKGRRVASHPISGQKNGISTNPDHMPPTHRYMHEWNAEDALEWALEIGPETHAFMQVALSKSVRRDDKYRVESGLRKLASEYGNDRLEAACKRALSIGATAIRNVRSILQTNLDKQHVPASQREEAGFEHENIRGPQYYH